MIINRDGRPCFPETDSGNYPENDNDIIAAAADVLFLEKSPVKIPGGYVFVSMSDRSGWKLASFISNSSLRASYYPVTAVNVGVSLIFVLVITAVLYQCVNALIEKEKTERKMAYSLLISQIGPHFIYNTMNTINYLARRGRTEDVVTVNNALIQILQDMLKVGVTDIMDTVSKEFAIAENYMTIQRYRFGSYVDVSIKCDENAKNLLIPKNLIQPILENSIVHGILSNLDEDQSPKGGIIYVRGHKEDNCAVITITDDGAGINSKELTKLNSWIPESRKMAAAEEESKDTAPKAEDPHRGKHLGLKNVRERLYYLYDRVDLLDIKSEYGKGTTVTLRIPANAADAGKSEEDEV